MPQRTVSDVLAEHESFRLPLQPGFLSAIEDEAERWQKIEEANRAEADHKADFKTKPYNIWKQHEGVRAVQKFKF